MPLSAITSYGIWPSGPVLVEKGTNFTIVENGFDTMTLKYYGNTTDPVNFAATNFAKGSSPLGYFNMFINGVNISREGTFSGGNQIYTFDVTATGLLNPTQPVKRTISSKVQTYTTGSVDIPGGLTNQPAQGLYINLSCVFYKVTNFPPNTATRPENAIPLGVLPTQPTNPFVSLPTTPIYNYPWGWIQDGLEIEQVNENPMYMVKQSWVYIYQYMPG
jgi:hypothetical protein